MGYTVALDCRWRSIGGAGRVTDLLLSGLRELAPPGWLLWGRPGIEADAWPGAGVRVTPADPRQALGQRAWFDVPDLPLVVFLHQQRPLRRVPAVTLVHDTIQLRNARTGAGRWARTAYLRRVAAVSRHVVTISDYSRACITRDLGVSGDRISVVRLPLDAERAVRVAGLRRSTPTEDFALYVGQFAPHKNLPRLVAAFGRTRFRARGGRLVLAGGRPDAVARLAASLPDDVRAAVDLLGWREPGELERLMATARLLVQPSLEEGFGLPVLEAMAAGVPVCVSAGGALPELVEGLVKTFDPGSIEEMARALDECAEGGAERAGQVAEDIRRRATTPRQFAAEMVAIAERAAC